jgi:Amt family ammonium transporter
MSARSSWRDLARGTPVNMGEAVGVTLLWSGIVAAVAYKLVDWTIGLRVTSEQEDAGLDISEHGMYGYPEQFIPPEEYPGGVTPTPARPATATAVTAAAAEQPSEA